MTTFPAKFNPDWPYITDYGYDVESYPNFFSLAARHVKSNALYFFEISEWQDDTDRLISWVYWLHQNKCRQLGYNNVHYDYRVQHFVFMNAPSWQRFDGKTKSAIIYEYSSSLFKTANEQENAYRDRMYKTSIRASDMIIPQIDFFKMYHFDNKNKATSLKVLQINMRRDDVKELPVKPGTVLTYEQRLQMIPYNIKDVDDTLWFAKYSLAELQLRERLTEMFGINMLNHNEGKIGEDIIKSKLVKMGVDTRKKTYRTEIKLSEVIFPYIKFTRPEFIELHNYLLNKVIDIAELADDDDEDIEKVKSKYPCAVINGFPWQFGRGGMHGSVEASIIREDDEYENIDVDVVSFYPREGIVNKLRPAHLGLPYCECYESVFELRQQYPKKQFPMENMAFKYSLNVPFGKSNSKFSFFYDPQYTMAITINGQLLLCMLGEWLMSVPGLSMIQANTDGLTFRVPRRHRDQVKAICKQWEQYTCLDLEYAYYQAMYIRDVNNYIAHYVPDEKNPEGAIKSKGAYVHSEIPWNKDHSAVVIARAVEKYFIKNIPVEETILGCRDPFDFLIKGKVPRSSELWLKSDTGNVQLQNTTRYFISLQGGSLVKIMPPTKPMIENWQTGTHYIRHRDGDYKVVKQGGKRPAKTYDLVDPATIPHIPPDRPISMQSGWKVTDCANINQFDWANLNYNYYIQEAYKLIDPLVKQC